MVKPLCVMIQMIISVSTAFGAQTAEKIAVLDFKSLLAPEQLGIAVAEILRTELGAIGNHTVIERGMLKQLLEEQAFQSSGTVDSETAVKIGKLVGANMVVAGSIIKTGDVYTINSRFIEVETGIVKIGKNIRGQGENQISNMVHQLAFMIAGKTDTVETVPVVPASPVVYRDDFASGIDESYWKMETNSGRYEVDDNGQSVRFSKNFGGDYAFQYIGLTFQREVRGDFDARIDFRDVRIAQADGSPGNQIELKASFGDKLFIVVFSDEPWLGGTNCHVWAAPPGIASGTQNFRADGGTLRIVRKGPYLSGYFNNTLIFTSQMDAGPAVNLAINLNNNGTKDATSVTFDNFYLSCGEMGSGR